jgi:hypothetical protein
MNNTSNNRQNTDMCRDSFWIQGDQRFVFATYATIFHTAFTYVMHTFIKSLVHMQKPMALSRIDRILPKLKHHIKKIKNHIDTCKKNGQYITTRMQESNIRKECISYIISRYSIKKKLDES